VEGEPGGKMIRKQKEKRWKLLFQTDDDEVESELEDSSSAESAGYRSQENILLGQSQMDQPAYMGLAVPHEAGRISEIGMKVQLAQENEAEY
jgi:hypothetical protein